MAAEQGVFHLTMANETPLVGETTVEASKMCRLRKGTRGQAMQCVNCRNEVNGVPAVCPYCHGSPIFYGTGPHFPKSPPIDPASDAALNIGVLGYMVGGVALFSCPPLGLAILGGAAISTLSGLFKKDS